MSFVIQGAVKGVAAGIGLASEGISAQKAKKQQQKEQAQSASADPTQSERSISDDHALPPNESRPHDEIQDPLEEQWALDEAQYELSHPSHSPPGYRESDGIDPDSLAHDFAVEHRIQPSYTPSADAPPPTLPAPVLLPQRRPKNRKRGFIRAYAPCLNDFGIDQAMFLEFLDTADKSCAASPWLNTINLASIGTMFLPSATAIAVSVAIQLTTDAAIAIDGRRR